MPGMMTHLNGDGARNVGGYAPRRRGYPVRVLPFFFLASMFTALAAGPANAALVISTWSPGVAVDPMAPEYVPLARPDYVWVPGNYDAFGYYRPGYWAPVAPNPGFMWVAGSWVGPVYYEGYWRPVDQPGSVWMDPYWCDGRYYDGGWVRSDVYEERRMEREEFVREHEPYREVSVEHHQLAEQQQQQFQSQHPGLAPSSTARSAPVASQARSASTSNTAPASTASARGPATPAPAAKKPAPPPDDERGQPPPKKKKKKH
jgi:hypothetical protein